MPVKTRSKTKTSPTKAPAGKTARSGSSARAEIIAPPRQLIDLVTIDESGNPLRDPIKNAEQQLAYFADEFAKWLDGDRDELMYAWAALHAEPNNVGAFIRFHKIVHTICGNAAMLDCPAASALAAPLARLLERSPDVAAHTKTINSAVSAISLSVSGELNDESAELDEIVTGLNKIISRWISSGV